MSSDGMQQIEDKLGENRVSASLDAGVGCDVTQMGFMASHFEEKFYALWNLMKIHFCNEKVFCWSTRDNSSTCVSISACSLLPRKNLSLIFQPHIKSASILRLFCKYFNTSGPLVRVMWREWLVILSCQEFRRNFLTFSVFFFLFGFVSD